MFIVSDGSLCVDKALWFPMAPCWHDSVVWDDSLHVDMALWTQAERPGVVAGGRVKPLLLAGQGDRDQGRKQSEMICCY